MPARYQPKREWLPTRSGGYGSGAGADGAIQTDNTWVERIASTSGAIYVTSLQSHNGFQSVELGTGGAGAETSVLGVATLWYAGPDIPLPIPVRIPTSTRVALRVGAVGNGGLGECMSYLNESSVGVIRPHLIPVSGAGSYVASVASSGTSWVQVIASTSAAILITHVSVYSQNGTYGNIDLGTGAAASESVIATFPFGYTDGSTNRAVTHMMRPFLRVPASTRIAYRAPSSNYSLHLHYVNESAVVW